MSELSDWKRHIYEPEVQIYKLRIKAAKDALEAKDRLIRNLVDALKAVDLARHTDETADWVKATDLTDAALSKAKEQE